MGDYLISTKEERLRREHSSSLGILHAAYARSLEASLQSLHSFLSASSLYLLGVKIKSLWKTLRDSKSCRAVAHLGSHQILQKQKPLEDFLKVFKTFAVANPFEGYPTAKSLWKIL